MKREIFFDLETRRCDDAELIAMIAAGIRPPSSIKKPETLARWEVEDRPALIEKTLNDTALDGAFGRVCCVAWAFDDDEPQSFVSSDERVLLSEWFTVLNDELRTQDGNPPVPVFINHALTTFDLPFLRKRSAILGLRPPRYLTHAFQARGYSEIVRDTMLMRDFDRDKRPSLDLLCKVFGIPSPKRFGIDGSKVQTLYDAGQYQVIGEYGQEDVMAARACYRKMQKLEEVA